jgi:hypothetical protein
LQRVAKTRWRGSPRQEGLLRLLPAQPSVRIRSGFSVGWGALFLVRSVLLHIAGIDIR